MRVPPGNRCVCKRPSRSLPTQSGQQTFSIQLFNANSVVSWEVVFFPDVICEMPLSAEYPESIARLNPSPGSNLGLRNYVVRDGDGNPAFFTRRIANNESVDSISRRGHSFSFPLAHDRETIFSKEFDRRRFCRRLVSLEIFTSSAHDLPANSGSPARA